VNGVVTLGPHTPEGASQPGGQSGTALDDLVGGDPDRQVDLDPPPAPGPHHPRREADSGGVLSPQSGVHLPQPQATQRGRNQLGSQPGHLTGRSGPADPDTGGSGQSAGHPEGQDQRRHDQQGDGQGQEHHRQHRQQPDPGGASGPPIGVDTVPALDLGQSVGRPSVVLHRLHQRGPHVGPVAVDSPPADPGHQPAEPDR
jgi:hypothetical protein